MSLKVNELSRYRATTATLCITTCLSRGRHYGSKVKQSFAHLWKICAPQGSKKAVGNAIENDEDILFQSVDPKQEGRFLAINMDAGAGSQGRLVLGAESPLTIWHIVGVTKIVEIDGVLVADKTSRFMGKLEYDTVCFTLTNPILSQRLFVQDKKLGTVPTSDAHTGAWWQVSTQNSRVF